MAHFEVKPQTSNVKNSNPPQSEVLKILSQKLDHLKKNEIKKDICIEEVPYNMFCISSSTETRRGRPR